MKAGKPVFVSAGPTNYPTDEPVPLSYDDLESILTERGFELGRQTILFNVELVYGGVFRLRNWPEQQLGAVLMIECPRLIFPFARQALANVTQIGGFPPLMMDPVDFAAIYRQNLAQLASAQQPGGVTGGPSIILDKSKTN